MLQVFNKRFKLRESCNAYYQNIELDQKSGKITQNKSSAKIPMNFAFATKSSNFRFNLHESYDANEHDKDCDQKGGSRKRLDGVAVDCAVDGIADHGDDGFHGAQHG